MFAEFFVTPTGRVQGPKLFCEFSAPYLDLADDAVKAALFAIVSGGFTLVAYAKREFVVEVPADATAEEAASAACRLIRFAEAAITNVLHGIPGKCSCVPARQW